MLLTELQELEEVKGLLTRGQQVGVLSYGEIASAVSEVDVDESDIEELYQHIEKTGIELVEDKDTARLAGSRASRTASAAAVERRRRRST